MDIGLDHETWRVERQLSITVPRCRVVAEAAPDVVAPGDEDRRVPTPRSRD